MTCRYKHKILLNIFVFVLLICSFSTEAFAQQKARGGIKVGGTVSQDLTPPAAISKKCLGTASPPSDDGCPREDNSADAQSSGDAGVTLPAPSGKKFTFAGLCSLTGKTNNACIEIVDCLENKGKCAIVDCWNNPSTDKCKQLCSADPTNAACAAFECADNPGADCCAVARIPECCDFFNILDGLQACRRNPGPECCGSITDFGGDSVFEDRCDAAFACQTNADKTCCNLYPEASKRCVAILGCVGLTKSTDDLKKESCCRVFPRNLVCDIYDCVKRIKQDGGYGCCQLIPDVDECAAFYTCMNHLKAGLTSTAAKQCCNSATSVFASDLQSCQALECIDMLSKVVSDPGVIASGGGSLEYCCSLVPNSETCQRFVTCFQNPDTECCDLFDSIAGTSIPACAVLACYNDYTEGGSKASDSDPDYPSESCCKAIPSIPKCLTVLNCIKAPTTSCCTLLAGTSIPVEPDECKALMACATTIADSSASFDDKSICCKIFPQEISSWCTDFFNCEANPTTACCDLASPYSDGKVCQNFMDCLINPTPQCCALFSNAATTTACVAILECIADPTYDCCIGPDLQKTPICANLIKCKKTGGIQCCKLFPEITSECESLLSCYSTLIQSKNIDNSCCDAFTVAQLNGFDLCNEILACKADLMAVPSNPSIKCCKLIPGDTFRTICEAFIAGMVPTVIDCYTPGVFGGCDCPPNSPGGSRNNSTIF